MKHILLRMSALLLFVSVLSAAFRQGENFREGKFKIGVALYSFHKQKFEDALKMAGQTGVRCVEGFSFNNLGQDFGGKVMIDATDEEITKILQLMAQNRITMTSMYVGNPGDAAGWKRIFDRGRKFGIKYFVCEPPKAHLDVIDSLAGIYRIKVAIHEHAKGSSIYWHPDSVLTAIKGRPNLGACADIGHWVRSGLDPVSCIKALDGHLIGLHMKDISKSGEDVDPGTGTIHFDSLFGELKRQQFDGYGQVECEHHMDNNLDDVKLAIAYYRDMLRK